MSVLSCLAVQHNIWIVALAAFVCASGLWVSKGLYARATIKAGHQRLGWVVLAGVATGASVWCTHFIAMLAYEAQATVIYDPLVTTASLIVAVLGSIAGIGLTLQARLPNARELGGAAVGLSIAAMHYIGMMGYRVDGFTEWHAGYVALSVAFALVLAALSFSAALERRLPYRHAPLTVLILAVVSLHFTGMTALTVIPTLADTDMSSAPGTMSMALAITAVSLIVAATGFTSYVIDTEATTEMVECLRRMALSDSLTGLPNRARFSSYLNEEIERARVAGMRVAVIGIDLDRFKEVNDLRGHDAGDTVLRALSSSMAEMLREKEFVARIGGDEFAAVKTFVDRADLLEFVARLETALFTPVRHENYDTATGASLGVSIFPEDGLDAPRLVNNADLAMYRAKADMSRNSCFYEKSMDEAARARHALALDLRKAVENNELVLHLQVQNSLQSGDVVGYEALVRWDHPTRGLVSPIDFIPLAEETGAIVAIGEWVLRTACREAASWSEPHRIAVNLSPVQFGHTNLHHLVHTVLLETGLTAHRLELELTESTIIADKVRTLHQLRQIKSLGVSVALDDFGTGYSSLDTLRSFPFDKIKLDRSFTSEIEHSQQALAIIRAMLTLGKTLNVPILAEGVETRRQLDILRDEGCDEAQGYYLGLPCAPVDRMMIANLRPTNVLSA